MRSRDLTPARTPRDWRRRRLAVALCAAPLVIGSPLLLEGLRNPAMIASRWDSWLIFVLMPLATAAALMGRGRR